MGHPLSFKNYPARTAELFCIVLRSNFVNSVVAVFTLNLDFEFRSPKLLLKQGFDKFTLTVNGKIQMFGQNGVGFSMELVCTELRYCSVKLKGFCKS